jgi:hypothetical protein
MRLPTAADLPLMIEAAAQAAWSTDRSQPIVAGTIAALPPLLTAPAPANVPRMPCSMPSPPSRSPNFLFQQYHCLWLINAALFI